MRRLKIIGINGQQLRIALFGFRVASFLMERQSSLKQNRGFRFVNRFLFTGHIRHPFLDETSDRVNAAANMTKAYDKWKEPPEGGSPDCILD